jgi:hypothetical protein
MDTHFMIFVSIGNPASSGIQFLFGRSGRGRTGPPPTQQKHAALLQTATRAATLWKVEFETS